MIHLVQHIAGQRMSTQLAEHHGSFATYLLMLAVGGREDMGDLYFPGERRVFVHEQALEVVGTCRSTALWVYG